MLKHNLRGLYSFSAGNGKVNNDPILDTGRSICYRYYIREIDMNTVTVSPKYQVVIPRAVREQMGIHPGERLEVISLGDRIELVPLRPMREMKGFLKGLNPSFERDEADRV